MVQADRQVFNPYSGQRMRFLQTAADTGGALLQIETTNPPGPADPEHVHPKQESSAQVLAGTLHFRIDGRDHIVRVGETIVIPVNTPHCFWNEDDDEAIAIQEFRPALRTEEFFQTYFKLALDGKLDKRGMPSILQLAVLVPEFGDEIRPKTPPWPLLCGIAWLLGPIARVRGYRSTYASTAR